MASQMAYSSEDEQLLMSRIWSPQIKNNPEAFVLFAFPWGQSNTPLANQKGPRKWQRRLLRKLAQHIAENDGKVLPDALRTSISSGRGVGKTTFIAWLIIWMQSCQIGSSVIVSANSESQLRTVTWGELSKWLAMAINSHWFDISATKMTPAAWVTAAVERDLKKGTRYWAAEGKLWSEENPDAYAGVHNHDGMMVIFEEAAGIPDCIWSVAAGFFTEPVPHRYWFAFSNPRRPKGYFFECFNSKRNFWVTENIDARTVEGTDSAIYNQIIEEYGADSDEAKVEVYGEFPSVDDGQFISSLVVRDAAARPKYKDVSSPVVIGVDPARGGSDSTIILVRRGRDVIEIHRFKGDDTMTVAGHVINAIEEFHPALSVIDEGGLGYGVLDRVNELGYKLKGVNFGWKSKHPAMWGNKRAEMWGTMRDWLKTASIPNDRQLIVDLTGVLIKPDSRGTIFLESKKEMKARGLSSPDAADALAVTFAFPVASFDISEKVRRASHSIPTLNYFNR